MECDGAPVFARLLDKSHDFQTDDREDTWHEVEN